MRKAVEPSTQINVELPASLAQDIRDLLLDPRTRKTRYGALNKLAIQLFGNWVDAQRNAHATRPRAPTAPQPIQLEDI